MEPGSHWSCHHAPKIAKVLFFIAVAVFLVIVIFGVILGVLVF